MLRKFFATVAGAAVLGFYWLAVADPVADPRGPDHAAAVRFRAVHLTADRGNEVALLGAWSVKVDDRRWGGESALVLDGGRLLAQSDFGVLTSLPRPGQTGPAVVHSLDLVDGDPAAKRDRDSEALVRDPDGRGWWVGFENRHAVAFYDRNWTQRWRLRLLKTGWSKNRGIEALLAEPGRLTAISEDATEVLTIVGSKVTRARLQGSGGYLISDSTRLPDGRIVVILRRLTPRGFDNALGWLVPDGAGWRVRRFAVLPGGPFDNYEGIAAEPLPQGAARLWLISDNDAFRWRRTLLIALRLAPAPEVRPRPTRR
ncbi:hypothetical protein HMF7854_02925 [Sphingomonas ginkgonis]|uniref:Phytase-like domain-containing protein n=1 Tax=Sphingomonas ginkgonis TaxID=2315330 RepID=A0A429V7G5_9SPHN|nr:esterase-like activity of phytase family protein [Sphingomonas ginkgonis]RST29890.1 hypothetical protein HMF7854_02925 [Sphingomonas ginkgonis]